MPLKASIITPEPVFSKDRETAIEALNPLFATKTTSQTWIISPDDLPSQNSTSIEIIFELPHVHEMAEGELLHFHKEFGFTPKGVIGLKTSARNQHAHRALGRAALALALQFSAVICFCGVLPTPKRKDTVTPRKPLPQISYEHVTESFFTELPGHICIIPYVVGRRMLAPAHYADTEFLKKWLNHPYFQMG